MRSRRLEKEDLLSQLSSSSREWTAILHVSPAMMLSGKRCEPPTRTPNSSLLAHDPPNLFRGRSILSLSLSSSLRCRRVKAGRTINPIAREYRPIPTRDPGGSSTAVKARANSFQAIRPDPLSVESSTTGWGTQMYMDFLLSYMPRRISA